LRLPAAFGYDANQIIRGIGRIETLERILNPEQGQYGPRSVFWGDYAITYQPWQSFKVSRVDRSGPKAVTDTSTTRTVYDVFGFFQKSFVKTIEKWNIATEQELAFVAKMKELREEFDRLTPAMVDYCKLECRQLAALMSAFREACIAADTVPERWAGPGWIAASLLKKHGIPKRPQTAKEALRDGASRELRRPERERQFEEAASSAYYGGRFEVSRIGHVPGPVWEYDLNSAYPHATLSLPCSMHTRWVHRPNARRLPKSGLYLAKITFGHSLSAWWCGLPFRRKTRLYWPYQGTGWYWSPEIEAARDHLFADVSVHDLWVAETSCDCRQYAFVPALYEKRRELGLTTQGYPLKLALNSISGKTAQRSGRGPYHDEVAAGLITANTRARLVEAVGHDPGAVVMLATDAVYSTRPLALDVGKGLGQWDPKIWPDLFIAQPGVYWSPTEYAKGEEPTIKSRGAPRSVIGKAAPRFVRKFDDWIARLREAGDFSAMLTNRECIPKVWVEVRIFHGCRLALARGKRWLAGTWKEAPRNISFDWLTKRSAAWEVKLADDGSDSLTTRPIVQSKHIESDGYKPVDFDSPLDDDDLLFEAMPDDVPWLPEE
jgi:DNA polymerase type B, organellar and viral